MLYGKRVAVARHAHIADNNRQSCRRFAPTTDGDPSNMRGQTRRNNNRWHGRVCTRINNVDSASYRSVSRPPHPRRHARQSSLASPPPTPTPAMSPWRVLVTNRVHRYACARRSVSRWRVAMLHGTTTTVRYTTRSELAQSPNHARHHPRWCRIDQR